MDPSDLGGAGGWLASLLGGGGQQPMSLAPPGIPAPTPDSAALPVNGPVPAPGGPSVTGALSALGSAGPGMQRAVARPAVPPPQINFPQPRGNPTAQALAQVMARMNQKVTP